MEIISRAAARDAGRKRYFTGKPCKYGHIAERWTSLGACVACGTQRSREWNAANREKGRQQRLAWYHANKEKAIASRRKWEKSNPEKVKAKHDRLKAANPEKYREYARKWEALNPERRRDIKRKWRGEHPDRVNAEAATRRARKRAATAPLTEAEQHAVKEIYAKAREITQQTGIRHDVDHDKPLARGGAHHPSNLIIVPARLNRSKGARYDSTMDYILS